MNEASARRRTNPLYPPIAALVKLFSPRYTLEGTEQLPDEPCIVVANHCQMYGPIACEFYMPFPRRTWCAGEMMRLREVPDYAFHDFWPHKPRAVQWFYRLLSYLIAPLSVLIFNNAKTIPVYHDARVITTFRRAMSELDAGVSSVIFPEHEVPYNGVLWDFQDKFIDLARLYHRRSGRALCFVPLYIAPRLGKLVFGSPARFDPDAPIAAERERIKTALMEEITARAAALPRHTVVPYPNIPKREYPENISIEKEPSHAQARC